MRHLTELGMSWNPLAVTDWKTSPACSACLLQYEPAGIVFFFVLNIGRPHALSAFAARGNCGHRIQPRYTPLMLDCKHKLCEKIWAKDIAVATLSGVKMSCASLRGGGAGKTVNRCALDVH
jgi:hypothetical protein